MKQIITIILTLFITLSCKAQDIVNLGEPLASNKYFKDFDNKRANFVGTWHYTNGTTEFTLYIYKNDAAYGAVMAGPYTIDKIIGNYIYKENGVEIINTTNLLTNLNNITVSPFTARTENGVFIEDHVSFIKDYGRQYVNYDCEIRYKSGNVEMEITNLNSGQPLQATFKVSPIPHTIRMVNPNCDDSQTNLLDWSFPREMTLTKISDVPPPLN